MIIPHPISTRYKRNIKYKNNISLMIKYVIYKKKNPFHFFFSRLSINITSDMDNKVKYKSTEVPFSNQEDQDFAQRSGKALRGTYLLTSFLFSYFPGSSLKKELQEKNREIDKQINKQINKSRIRGVFSSSSLILNSYQFKKFTIDKL